MQIETQERNLNKNITPVFFHYGEGDYYRIRLGRWHRFVHTISCLARGRNDQPPFYQDARSSLSQVSSRGKRSCQTIIL